MLSSRLQVALCAWWLMLPLTGCVREHTLFDSGAGGQAGQPNGAAGEVKVADAGSPPNLGQAGRTESAAGSPAAGMAGIAGARGEAGTAGTPSAAWTESTCEAALGQGKTGDPCLEVFKCTTTADCCETIASCDGSALNILNNCALCPTKCSADSDCGAKSLCENYQCRSCPSDPCPDTWATVLRNNCPVCVPPNKCKMAGDPVCGELICAPGLSCLPGCKDDPACCFGNQCVPRECPSLKAWDCLLVGCAAGSLCKVSGPASECKCYADSGTFVCPPPNGNSNNNTCVAL